MALAAWGVLPTYIGETVPGYPATVLPNTDQGLGILLAAVGIGFLLVLAARGGFGHLSFFGFTFQRTREKTAQELEWDHEAAISAAGATQRQLAEAFRRYSEAAVAMAEMSESPGPADRSLRGWFDVCAASLAAGLTVYPEDHFRTAIWADLGDPDSFTLLGAANHDRNDPKMATLGKAATIAGHTWRSKAGEYLCVDVKKDRRYKARSATPRPYVTIFAVRLGESDRPWGVMTIDAPRADVFGEAGLVIVRRFAKLISAGAAIAAAKYGPAPSRVLAALPPAPPRIVASSEPPGVSASEGTVDD